MVKRPIGQRCPCSRTFSRVNEGWGGRIPFFDVHTPRYSIPVSPVKDLSACYHLWITLGSFILWPQHEWICSASISLTCPTPTALKFQNGNPGKKLLQTTCTGRRETWESFWRFGGHGAVLACFTRGTEIQKNSSRSGTASAPAQPSSVRSCGEHQNTVAPTRPQPPKGMSWMPFSPSHVSTTHTMEMERAVSETLHACLAMDIIYEQR